MDKLQPLVTHRFWIAVGLAVILGLVGWWMGTADLAATIDSRTSAIEALNVTQGAAQPNERWVEQAAEVAGEREARLSRAARDLADTQENLRVWPEGYRPYVEGLPYFGEISYNGRDAYVDFYPGEVESAREVVRPYDPEEQTGVVAFAPGVVPQFSTADWRTVPPQSNTVWAAQEDVWLLRQLLAQTVKINEGVDFILDAPLKEIQSLTLRGGSSGEEAAGATGRAGATGKPAAAASGDEEDGAGYAAMMMGGMDMMGGGGAAKGPEVTFDLSDEVGSDAGPDDDPALAPKKPEGAAGGSASAKPGAVSGGDDDGAGYAALMMGGMEGPGGGAGTKEEEGAVSPGGGRRYIASDPELPYRTRAFQMTVAVDHRRLPELLVHLANCAWPVEIVRVHQREGAAPAGHGMRGGVGGGVKGGMMGMMGGGGLGGGGLGGDVGDDYEQMMMGGLGGGGLGGGKMGGGRGGATRERVVLDPSDPYQVALADPYLATVVIGGVMTIYKPLDAEEEAAADALDATDPLENLAAGAPPADAPADPAAAAGAEPVAAADGAADAAADAPADPETPAEMAEAEAASVDAEAEGAAELDLGFGDALDVAPGTPAVDADDSAADDDDDAPAENDPADARPGAGLPDDALEAAAAGSGG